MKTRIIILLYLLIYTLSFAEAQDRKVEKAVRMDTINVDYKTRYISQSFGDNFYIQGAFAGRMLMGSEDTALPFGKRIKPGFSLAVGKQFHPDFGIRLSFGGMRLDGWTSGPTGLNAYDDGWYQHWDPVEEYWKEQGVDTQSGYKQEIRYFETNADILFDLYNIFTPNNRFNRRWTAEAYTGIGYLKATRYHGMDANAKFSFRLGLIGEYHINRDLGINLEIGSAITDASFTGEIGKGNRYCNILTASIGLRWQISRNRGFRVVRLVPQSQLQALSEAVTNVSSQTVEESDTIMRQRQAVGTLLIPSVVFYPYEDNYNEELQELNVYRMARYMMRYKDIKVAVVGNIGGTDESLARRRAERVRDVLVNRYGITPERLVIRTYDVNAKYGVTGYEQSVNFAVAE